jgi:DNA-binding PadR family transcriptional regulator
MQRKKGTLTTIEVRILSAALQLRASGLRQVHGFRLAQAMQEEHEFARRPAYGTLYRALDRMADMGLLESSWEDPNVAADLGRPRRRFYEVTAAGEVALAAAADSRHASTPSLQPGPAQL